MLLLTDSISKEDSCWELRLRCGEFGGHLVSSLPEKGEEASGRSPRRRAGEGRGSCAWAALPRQA